MIQLENLSLSSSTSRSLRQYQAEVDGEPDFPSRVAKAKKIWPSKKQNKPFEEIKTKLTTMCAGAKRCCYCEDSAADEIEHIFPKNIYPEKTFVWENYLYACGPCNGPKNDNFAVFDLQNGALMDVTPPRNMPGKPPQVLTPPKAGDPVLINPRKENPLDFLFLDLKDTFHFIEWEDDETTRSYKRAEYTIELLKLNTRDLLPQARSEAYGDYKARLAHYIIRKNNGAPASELAKMKRGILSKQHPTVWAEMKRQQDKISELKALFDQAPEALEW